MVQRAKSWPPPRRIPKELLQYRDRAVLKKRECLLHEAYHFRVYVVLLVAVVILVAATVVLPFYLFTQIGVDGAPPAWVLGVLSAVPVALLIAFAVPQRMEDQFRSMHKAAKGAASWSTYIFVTFGEGTFPSEHEVLEGMRALDTSCCNHPIPTWVRRRLLHKAP